MLFRSEGVSWFIGAFCARWESRQQEGMIGMQIHVVFLDSSDPRLDMTGIPVSVISLHISTPLIHKSHRNVKA